MSTASENDPAGARPAAMRFRIEQVRTETPEVVSWWLRRVPPTPGQPPGESGLPHGAPPPPAFTFVPGQYNLLGETGLPVAIAGDPSHADEIVHALRIDGTPELAGLRAGDIVPVRGPFGTGWPDATGRDLIMVAGGRGMASLRPMICRIYDNRREYGRVAVTVGARTPDLLLFAHEYDMWRAAGIEIFVIVDHRRANWKGRIGVVTNLLQRLGMDTRNCLTLLSGSELMVRFAVRELLALSHAEDTLFVSMARNLHPQGLRPGEGEGVLAPEFVRREGPVFPWSRIRDWLRVAEG